MAKTYRDEAGQYLAQTLVGCYPVYHLTDDGECMCAACANNPRNPIHEDEPNDGWRLVGSDINYEDAELFCVNCNERIPSAYVEE